MTDDLNTTAVFTPRRECRAADLTGRIVAAPTLDRRLADPPDDQTTVVDRADDREARVVNRWARRVRRAWRARQS